MTNYKLNLNYINDKIDTKVSNLSTMEGVTTFNCSNNNKRCKKTYKMQYL